jgi:hypothetical protein
MPKKVKILLGPNKLLRKECWLNDCHPKCKCKAFTKSGKKCRIKNFRDKDYCHIHLKKKFDVAIGKSNIYINGHSIGLGLFARSHRPVKDMDKIKKKSTKENRDKYLVFKNKDIIGKYEGEILTKKELDKRYDYKIKKGKKFEKVETTAPYTIERDDGKFIDGACKRNFIAYANDPHGTKLKTNAKLLNDTLVATRNIWQGDEILWSYGKSYWSGEHAIIA